jgi:hypothetical protein
MAKRTPPTPILEVNDSLMSRARKWRKRGDIRKAVVALRELCLRDESCARSWTIYGTLLVQMGRKSDGVQALNHAIWLRKIQGDKPRMKSTQQWMQHLHLQVLLVS